MIAMYQTKVIMVRIPLTAIAVNNITRNSNIVQIIQNQVSAIITQREKQNIEAESSCFLLSGRCLFIKNLLFKSYYNLTYYSCFFKFFWKKLITNSSVLSYDVEVHSQISSVKDRFFKTSVIIITLPLMAIAHCTGRYTASTAIKNYYSI